MEKVCTQHLKDIGGWLAPEFKEVNFTEKAFPVEASVIIPVRNRIKTIEDAVRSVFKQQTDFAFNLIVVDNHSSDGTTELLQKLAKEDERLIHFIPERKDLAGKNYRGLQKALKRYIQLSDHVRVGVQFNPERIYSSAAKVDDKSIKDIFEQVCYDEKLFYETIAG